MSGVQDQPPPPQPSPVQANAQQGWQPGSGLPGMAVAGGIATIAVVALFGAWRAGWFDKGHMEMREAQREVGSGYSQRPAAPEPPPDRTAIQQAVDFLQDNVLGRQGAGQGAAVIEPPRVTGLTSYRPRPAKREEAPGEREAARALAEKPETLAGMPVLRSEVYRGDPRTMLTPGDVIPCITTGPMTGRVGDPFRAEIPEGYRVRDGLGPNIPPGSTAFGQVVAAPNLEGETRILVNMKHIQYPTPPGKPLAVVLLNSPGGEGMGDIGLAANVRTHTLSRWMAVASYALLDVGVGAGAALAQDAITGGGNGPNINIGPQIRGMGQSLAGQEFGHRIRQPPTTHRPQGQPCTIVVNAFADTSAAHGAWWQGRMGR